jgi:hypothetical protein
MKCPVCGIEWLSNDFNIISDLGCPSCHRQFDIGELEQDDRIFTPEEVADWFIKRHDDKDSL